MLIFNFIAVRPCIDRNMFSDITVKAGQPIKFDVNVAGEPPPKITWMVNDKDLKSETRTTLENVDYNTKLTIRRVTRADSGKYTINAVNESGKDTAFVNVLVIGNCATFLFELLLFEASYFVLYLV